jgi:hypothetical protein
MSNSCRSFTPNWIGIKMDTFLIQIFKKLLGQRYILVKNCILDKINLKCLKLVLANTKSVGNLLRMEGSFAICIRK